MKLKPRVNDKERKGMEIRKCITRLRIIDKRRKAEVIFFGSTK